MTKEYLFLFNTVVRAADDLRDLQAWVSTMCDYANVYRFAGAAEDAAESMYGTLRKLETHLQQFQLMFIEAQQKAEEIYLDGEEQKPH